MLLIAEMCVLSFVARMYYRRHMEIPYEERILSTMTDTNTMTTDSLARGDPFTTVYGATAVASMATLEESITDPPLVLLNQRATDGNQRVVLSDKYRVAQNSNTDTTSDGIDENKIFTSIHFENDTSQA